MNLQGVQMVEEDGLRNFGRALYDFVNLEATLATAISTVPGFAEYYMRKNISKDILGIRFQSGILDMVVNSEDQCVFCVLGYSDSMGDENITVKVFKDYNEYTSTTSFRKNGLIANYQGIISTELPSGQNNLAEMVLKLYEKQVHFDIHL